MNHQKVIFGVAVLAVLIELSCGQQPLKGNQEDPCKQKARVVADETYCDRYWECVNNQPELYDCPNGLVFAGKHRGVTEGCDYPWRAQYCEGKQLANGPVSTEHCDWLYGIFGHETSCTRYWTCWNGTATEQLCIGGLLYNENAHSCDWPENVDGCQKHPLCNEDANGNVPLGKSCNRYWQCQGGYPRLQRCPAMLVFDKHSLRCVVPPTEECDIPTTIAPPEGDENSNPNDLNNGNANNQGNYNTNDDHNNYNNNNNHLRGVGGNKKASSSSSSSSGGGQKDNKQQQQQRINEDAPTQPQQNKNFQRPRN